MMKLFLAISLCILAVACSVEKSSAEIERENKRYHVICVDSNGKEYYNKIGDSVSRDGGNIAVYFNFLDKTATYIKYDIVTGNCVAAQFDIREKKE